MDINIQDKLISEFSYMFDMNGDLPIALFGIECNNGWYNLIQDTLQKIKNIDTRQQCKIFQIKEKFAGIRIYLDVYPIEYDATVDIIKAAELNSFETCELCGEKGHLANINGWRKTLCNKHEEERRRS